MVSARANAVLWQTTVAMSADIADSQLWALNGIVLRSARAMELHEGMAQLKHSCLDQEVRRRLWCYLATLDARVAEDCGLPFEEMDSAATRSKLPLHISDAGLCAETTESPPEEDKWTDMTILRTFAETQRGKARVATVLNRAEQEDPLHTAERIAATIRTRIENKYLRHCDPNVPLQRATLMLSRVLLSDLFVFSIQRTCVQSPEAAEGKNETYLNLVLETLQQWNAQKSDELLRSFQWYIRSFTPYHVIVFALWYLWRKPTGGMSDRLWEALRLHPNVDSCSPSAALHDGSMIHSEVALRGSERWYILRQVWDKIAAMRASAMTPQICPALGSLSRSGGIGSTFQWWQQQQRRQTPEVGAFTSFTETIMSPPLLDLDSTELWNAMLNDPMSGIS